jgi:hypothetical protein
VSAVTNSCHLTELVDDEETATRHFTDARESVGRPCVLSHLSNSTCRPPLVDPHVSTCCLPATIQFCSSATDFSDQGTHTRASKSFVRRNSLMSAVTHLCHLAELVDDDETGVHDTSPTHGRWWYARASNPTCRPPLVDSHSSTPTCRPPLIDESFVRCNSLVFQRNSLV